MESTFTRAAPCFNGPADSGCTMWVSGEHRVLTVGEVSPQSGQECWGPVRRLWSAPAVELLRSVVEIGKTDGCFCASGVNCVFARCGD